MALEHSQTVNEQQLIKIGFVYSLFYILELNGYIKEYGLFMMQRNL